MEQRSLYSMSTDYKAMMDFQRIDNNIYALVIYLDGDGVVVDGTGQISSLLRGIERYEFPNSKYCDLGKGLFDKIMDYQLFLCQEVVENKYIRDLAKTSIDAFNIKYNKQTNASWRDIMLAKHNLYHDKERQVIMNPYAKHITWGSSRNIPNLFKIKNIRPIFKSAYQQSSTGIGYVYELELRKVINKPNSYLDKACINISLFDNTDAAKQYLAQSVIEQQKFAEHDTYKELHAKCIGSIIRFDKYANSKNMSR